ncbi:MAG: hypothetical protein ACI861_000392 [Paracoccaceae bacterium]|jgi:hypothetical protein
MSIFTALGAGSGPIVGGAATVVAAALVSYVVLGPVDRSPVVGQAPAAITSPRVDVVATNASKTTSATLVVPKIEPAASSETTNTAITASDETKPSAASSAAVQAAIPLDDSSDIELGGTDEASVAAGDTSGQLGEILVASTDLGQSVKVSTDPSAKPEVAEIATGLNLGPRLKIDLVRIDKFGSSVVAGKAVPGGEIEIYLNGQVVAEVVADTKGAFVALFDIPVSQEAQVMTMALRDNSGTMQSSSDRVMVMGREVVKTTPTVDTAPDLPDDQGAPQIIIATDEGVKILQPAAIKQDTPEVMANISLDLITYDTDGEVVLTGRSDSAKHVRVYINGEPVKTESVAADGTWTLRIPEVDAGQYILRVDEIDALGQVTSRIETPFQKEDPNAVKRVASIGAVDGAQGPDPLPVIEKITIQPGATLWALAEATYGQGDLYMQIFNANKDYIKNPDLIYPGQIFEIPD